MPKSESSTVAGSAVIGTATVESPVRMIEVSDEEVAVLRTVLSRESISRPSYNGLRQLLSLSPIESDILLAFLRKI